MAAKSALTVMGVKSLALLRKFGINPSLNLSFSITRSFPAIPGSGFTDRQRCIVMGKV
ncbi:MAG TPA: hypothetical protein VL949_08450 [Geobacteraceae bacterium]|nr:hypothetical protein [Geobacteraceae bacterium]